MKESSEMRQKRKRAEIYIEEKKGDNRKRAEN